MPLSQTRTVFDRLMKLVFPQWIFRFQLIHQPKHLVDITANRDISHTFH